MVDFPDADLIADVHPIDRSGSSLLDQAASGMERAMADVDAERLIRIYAEAVLDVWDPYKIAYRNLGYLAWAMGVNLWDDGWRETTKRTWTARQWEFKSLRGTEAGARMAIEYVGRDVAPFGYQVLGFTTPPQQVFSGPSLTREEREAWLATLPQIRVWRTYERGTAWFGKAFYGGRGSGRLHNHRFCLGAAGGTKGSAIIPTTALDRLKRRARYALRGIETDTTVSEFGQYWRVHIRSTIGRKVFCDRPIAPGRFYIPSDAWKRLISVTPTPRLAWRSPVTPTVEPLTAEPERVVVNGSVGHRVFCDRPMRLKAFYIPSDAWARIYERYAINDGSAEVQRRRPVQFMGIGYYGFPKYTARVRVSLRSIRKWGVFSGSPFNRRFYLAHDPTPVLRARRAVMASKKLTDRVLLELGPVPSFVAGKPFIAGVNTFIVGRSF